FSTDLDAETKQRIQRGQLLTELLKQPQYSPYAVWQMYAMLLAATKGCFDNLPLAKVKPATEALLQTLSTKHAKLTETLNTGDKPTDDQNETITKIAQEIAKSYAGEPSKTQSKDKE
ncbi:MAG: F0F1 ATP synthase subunit alpha, partial [Candidatus Saccharimonadales bacterium]